MDTTTIDLASDVDPDAPIRFTLTDKARALLALRRAEVRPLDPDDGE